MRYEWSKTLTKTDVQRKASEKTMGVMPFLRFTKSKLKVNHLTWFRRYMFGKLNWKTDKTLDLQFAEIEMSVMIKGKFMGTRKMWLTHDPKRAVYNSQPTTRLHYDSITRDELSEEDLAGLTISVQRGISNPDTFIMNIG